MRLLSRRSAHRLRAMNLLLLKLHSLTPHNNCAEVLARADAAAVAEAAVAEVVGRPWLRPLRQQQARELLQKPPRPKDQRT